MDNFMGSGTSGESAVRLERNFVGVEKSEEYFKMAKERIEAAELQTSLIKQIMPSAPVDHKTDTEETW
jgi:DNA modification methylase